MAITSGASLTYVLLQLLFLQKCTPSPHPEKNCEIHPPALSKNHCALTTRFSYPQRIGKINLPLKASFFPETIIKNCHQDTAVHGGIVGNHISGRLQLRTSQRSQWLLEDVQGFQWSMIPKKVARFCPFFPFEPRKKTFLTFHYTACWKGILV